MGLPAKKRSKQQKRERRSHHRLKPLTSTTCPKCKSPRLPHRVCANCGFYKDRDVLEKDVKEEYKKKRIKKRESKSTA